MPMDTAVCYRSGHLREFNDDHLNKFTVSQILMAFVWDTNVPSPIAAVMIE